MADREERVVRLDRALLDDVTLIAKKHHRTLKGEVAWVLEKHVEEHRHVLEAAKQEAA